MPSQIEILAAKEDIREQLVKYSILLDGDGIGVDRKLWAQQLFTHDAVFVSYFPSGEQQLRIEGRDQIGKMFDSPIPTETSTRHYMVGTVFDEIGNDTAKTRSNGLLVRATRDALGAASGDILNGGEPLKSAIVIYHDDWRREDGTWKKVLSVLRRAT